MKCIKSVDARCDLFCDVYDPVQARIEAQAVYDTVHKYNESDDSIFKQRCILIKEEHDLHDLFWQAPKAAGETKKSTDQAVAQKLLDLVDEIGEIFSQTKDGYDYKTAVKTCRR